jgi:hypothetical protein
MYVFYYKKKNIFFYINFINFICIFKFTQEDFRKFISKWIITDDQPFTTLKNKYFRQMIKFLNSNAFIPSADTAKKDIMEIFEMEQIKMKMLFQVSLKFMFKYIFLKNIYFKLHFNRIYLEGFHLL